MEDLSVPLRTHEFNPYPRVRLKAPPIYPAVNGRQMGHAGHLG